MSPVTRLEPSPVRMVDDHNKYQAIPIYCIVKSSPKNIVSAVRVSRNPLRRGVIPLSREAFGLVWDSQEVMQYWMETPVDEGWENAKEEFNAILDYLREILYAILHVLRTGKFQDGTPVTLSRWPFLSKFDVNKIGIQAICTDVHVIIGSLLKPFTPFQRPCPDSSVLT